MSRLPPMPPASQPVHGPEGVAKTSVDISHRVRHQLQRADAATADPVRRSQPVGADPVWTVLAAAAALGLGYWAGRRVV